MRCIMHAAILLRRWTERIQMPITARRIRCSRKGNIIIASLQFEYSSIEFIFHDN